MKQMQKATETGASMSLTEWSRSNDAKRAATAKLLAEIPCACTCSPSKRQAPAPAQVLDHLEAANTTAQRHASTGWFGL